MISVIDAAVNAETDAMRARLARLVAAESPSLDREASAAIAALLAEEYATLGGRLTEHRNSTGTHVVADFPGEGSPLLLVGHSDTVWPRGTIEDAVPLVMAAQTVSGPGVYDMKSGLVIIETALRVAGRMGRRRAVRVVVTADEEVGSPGSRELVERAADGVMGAIGFESPHPDGSLKVGRRGSTRLQLKISGREAHAALDPGLGVSAIDELVDQLLRVREHLADLAAEGRDVLGNVGTVAGGSRANVVAGSAAAELGLRFQDPATERETLDWFARLEPVRPGASITAELASHRPAWLANDGDRGFATALSAAAGTSLGGLPAAGAGDVNFVAALGVPCVDGFGPRGRGAHAANERIDVASMTERTAALTRILLAPTLVSTPAAM